MTQPLINPEGPRYSRGLFSGAARSLRRGAYLCAAVRRFIGLLLLGALLLQHGLKLGVVAWWTLNQDRIARMLCENRDKPQLKCCGRCVLTKKLRKTDGSDKDPARTATERLAKQEPAVVPVALQWAARPVLPVPSRYTAAPEPGILAGSPAAPFHPPQA